MRCEPQQEFTTCLSSESQWTSIFVPRGGAFFLLRESDWVCDHRLAIKGQVRTGTFMRNSGLPVSLNDKRSFPLKLYIELVLEFSRYGISLCDKF